MRGLSDEAEGIQFDPVVSPLEDAAHWVQWAESGVTSNSIGWAQKNSDVRYNLGQFWAAKNERYQDAPTGWDQLDYRAHKAWAALAELGMVADNPPAQARYHDEAQKAYAGAMAAADRLGLDSSGLQKNAQAAGVWFQTAQKNGVDDSMRAAVQQRADELMQDVNTLLGLPWWAWAAGGLALVWLLYGRK
jgi:hypothetical protein